MGISSTAIRPNEIIRASVTASRGKKGNNLPPTIVLKKVYSINTIIIIAAKNIIPILMPIVRPSW